MGKEFNTLLAKVLMGQESIRDIEEIKRVDLELGKLLLKRDELRREIRAYIIHRKEHARDY
jgi:hypothetical protein